jgi:hypothetical protein
MHEPNEMDVTSACELLKIRLKANCSVFAQHDEVEADRTAEPA